MIRIAHTPWLLGLLCTARYILPTIGGLPFVGRYFAAAKAMKKSDLSAA